MEVLQLLGGWIRAIAAGLHRSHSNTGSEPGLRPVLSALFWHFCGQRCAIADDQLERESTKAWANSCQGVVQYAWAPTFYFSSLSRIFFLLFRAAFVAYGGSQVRCQIGPTAAGLCHSHSNTRSLIHWVRPGIELTSSCILIMLTCWAIMETPTILKCILMSSPQIEIWWNLCRKGKKNM